MCTSRPAEPHPKRLRWLYRSDQIYADRILSQKSYMRCSLPNKGEARLSLKQHGLIEMYFFLDFTSCQVPQNQAHLRASTLLTQSIIAVIRCSGHNARGSRTGTLLWALLLCKIGSHSVRYLHETAVTGLEGRARAAMGRLDYHGCTFS
jgi:hypothetical protein